MKSIPIVVELELQKVSLKLKFPAYLSIEIEIGRDLINLDHKSHEVLNKAELSKGTLSLGLRSEISTKLSYNPSTKDYDTKKVDN